MTLVRTPACSPSHRETSEDRARQELESRRQTGTGTVQSETDFRGASCLRQPTWSTAWPLRQRNLDDSLRLASSG